MRFFNASHVDYSGLHERRPFLGKCFLVLAAILLPLSICGTAYVPIFVTMVVTLIAWFVAWFSIVGAFYRMPLSAAFLVQLAVISVRYCECA